MQVNNKEREMHITLIKVEAPSSLESFIRKEMGLSYPEYRALFPIAFQQVFDLLWRASARLEQFTGSGRSKGKEYAGMLLKDAEDSLAMAVKLLGEISSLPVECDEAEEEKVCRICGGRNGSIARNLVEDVFTGITINGGRVSSATIGNAFAAWYRVARELKTIGEQR